jgi:hypothetical protein
LPAVAFGVNVRDPAGETQKMVSGDPMTGALLVAFNALIEVTTPDRIVPVLRHAVTTLLAEGPASAGTTPKTLTKSRRPWVGDLETWAPMRKRILAVLAARGISRRGLGVELKIPYNTLRPSLLPHGHAPSRANIERLQRWLEATESHPNGHAVVAEEAVAPRCSAYRLTAAQREQLAGYRQLDEQTTRRQTGVTIETIDQAIAGRSLAPEIISRLAAFLAQAAPASS